MAWMESRLGLALVAAVVLCPLAHGQATTGGVFGAASGEVDYKPHDAAPRAGAGYVLPDGTIRIVVYREMAGVIRALNALFVQTHPGVKFEVLPGDNYSGMAALTFDVTAFAPLGSEFTRIGLGDNLKISPEPTGFRIAHASLKSGAMLSPLAVIVNKSNPLEHLTIQQVTRIFAAGGPVSDITEWGQVGVQGTLASREIRPCGPPGSDYFAFDDPQVGEFIGLRLMGGLSFNHVYEPLPHYAEIVQRVGEDSAAIGITTLNRLSPEVKVVGLTAARSGTPSRGSADDIQRGRYPYDRYLYIYLRSNAGVEFDPFAKEYMRMVLSAQGQQAIAAEAEGYVPLNRREMADELAKLEQ